MAAAEASIPVLSRVQRRNEWGMCKKIKGVGWLSLGPALGARDPLRDALQAAAPRG